jgi:acyl carrier protein
VPTLEEILRQQFPDAVFDPADPHLGVGSFPEWDSLGTFNLLMLVETAYGVRFNPEDVAELKTLADIRTRLRTLGVEA